MKSSIAPAARGLTLVEVLVALAVLGVLLAVAAPSLTDMMNRRRTLAVAEQLMSDIAYARVETGLRAQNLFMTFGGDASQTCYTINYFPAFGGGCDCRRGAGNACTTMTGAVSANQELKTVSALASQGVSITIDRASWSGDSANELAFVTPQMTVNPANAAFDVVGRGGTRLRVQLNSMGRVSLCSRSGSIGGVLPCP